MTLPVQAFTRYNGAPYAWARGGPYPKPGGDCSGLFDWVVGHDLKQTLPMGIKNFRGQFHGPVVSQWATTTLCDTLPHGTAPSPGDIAIWVGVGVSGHMGLVTGPNQMFSSFSTAKGTCFTKIWIAGPMDASQGTEGPAGAPLIFRRWRGSPGGAVIPPGGCAAPAGTAAAIMAAIMIGGYKWAKK